MAAEEESAVNVLMQLPIGPTRTAGVAPPAPNELRPIALGALHAFHAKNGVRRFDPSVAMLSDLLEQSPALLRGSQAERTADWVRCASSVRLDRHLRPSAPSQATGLRSSVNGTAKPQWLAARLAHGHQRPTSRSPCTLSCMAALPPRQTITAPMAERSDSRTARPRVAASSRTARQYGSHGGIGPVGHSLSRV